MYLENVFAEEKSKGLEISFNSSGYGYSMLFKPSHGNMWEDDIISEHKSWGQARIWIYRDKETLLCKLYYDQVDDGVYDGFLELAPYVPL